MASDSFKSLRQIIDQSQRVVFFGGAGVSTESGIPDFRSATGLYSQRTGVSYSPEEILGHSFFIAHTEEFFSFYKAHLLYPEAQPNSAHLALAALESQGKVTAVITQNIDGLHQKAGSTTVIELHGNAHRNYCVGCRKTYAMDFILASTGVPRCEDCSGLVRPDVVLYEESLNSVVMAQAARVLSQADTLIVGGTSLVVYPAAGLLNSFRGKELILINKEPTPSDDKATLVIHEPIGQALAEFLT